MEEDGATIQPMVAIPWKSLLLSGKHIEIDTLEYQQTEKIETELEDVDRIRIRKVYACCPGWHSGGS